MIVHRSSGGNEGGKRSLLATSPLRGTQRMEATMANASQIKEQMAVKGSDGKHVGTVLGVENGPEADIRRHGPRYRHRDDRCRGERHDPVTADCRGDGQGVALT